MCVFVCMCLCVCVHVSGYMCVYICCVYISDRLGLAFELARDSGAEGYNITVSTPGEDVFCVYNYRMNSVEEGDLAGIGHFPASGEEFVQLQFLANEPNTAIVQWGLIMYGLPNTLDYPWSISYSGLAYVNTTVQ